MLGESPASGEARVEISLSVAGLRPRYLETSETLSGRCRYRLRAFSPWLDPQSLIGEPTELRLFETGGRLRRIPARIETARLEMHAEDGAPELELELTDPLAPLASRRNTRLFLESSLVEIAATILGEHGIDPSRLDLRGPKPPVRAHRLQAFEDDWSFLSRLLIREGYCHALEGAGDDWRWVWSAPQSPDFDAARDPLPVIEPGAPLATSDGRGRAAFDFAGESVEHCPERGSLRRLHLRGDVARLAPGCRFNLTGPATLEEHTRVGWIVEEVSCGWDRDEEGMRASIVAQLVDASLLAPEPRPPRVPEFFHARVESSGRFAEPDDEGRYRIRYGFDREDRPRAAASAPLSLISPYAGRDGAGWHFPLSPDGQLLLSTVNGDPDQPLIVGHLSSLDDPGPVLGTEAGAHRIVSASGQRLALDDSPNRRHILLQTLDGRVYLALNADKPEQGPDHSVRMACAHGALRIQAGRQVGLRAGESLLHKAGQTWRSTVTQSARIEAGADIHERTPKAWFADARGRFSLAADALSFRARAFEGRAARIRVGGRHIQLRTGEEARLQARAPVKVKNTGQALWLGTEKAGFLLEGNRITIKARALSLEARTGIRRTGRHDRTSDSASDTGAPRLESPAAVPELESTGHEGNARIEACCWSGEAETELGDIAQGWQQSGMPIGEGLSERLADFHVDITAVKQCWGKGTLRLEDTEGKYRSEHEIEELETEVVFKDVDTRLRYVLTLEFDGRVQRIGESIAYNHQTRSFS